MTKQELIALLLGNSIGPMQSNQVQSSPAQQMLGQNPPQGFQLMENGSLRGVLGGLGREGGGLIGQGFGALFGDENGVVDLGGGNIFTPGTGFQQQAQGPVQPGMNPPMASGLNFGALFNSIFGV